MRSKHLTIAVVLSLVVASSGCARGIGGTALGDPNPPRVEITQDTFGIRAGLDDAPVQLEIYTEPQCTHCADLQHEFGDQFAYYIGTGQLAITYRPMTFLDGPQTSGHSARIANALFVAARPGGDALPTTGRQFQHFVEQLWSHQQPGGPGPDDAAIAELARAADVPGFQVQQIAAGTAAKSASDLSDMESANFAFLDEIDPVNTGTPTVFDFTAGQKIDVYDDEWLSKLMAS